MNRNRSRTSQQHQLKTTKPATTIYNYTENNTRFRSTARGGWESTAPFSLSRDTGAFVFLNRAAL